MKKNLVLTGMMGSGKSGIGKSLSERLNMEFADTDSIIEERLSQISLQRRETAFLQLYCQYLNMEFADTDSIIEERLSLSVAKIFETKGEEFFRKIEIEESIKLIEKKGFVIALGGGAFISDKIRENVKKSCLSVWLQLDIDEIFKRTKNNQKRPLLNRNNSKEELDKLYKERKEIYSMADYKIDCNKKDKNEIVEEIKKIYENK